ncbi:MAG: selenocysteine-specific translation elongation factor [Candidatus Riflebacteria bacterium HGW-Riflebacteria-2]|jgi:selenocysteine-specific elongation factor|nr:MAG: selenocysteine-specific translation elongation factor [Candidatus Riflebacteria bacterium HGW-Riflebacteria-2]
MKHLIMGTAGHVDHGKTALIKALTGIECDTHKEEKARGITIHLGFACLPMPDGGKIGIIDVPGHRDFIHTMVSGASGIDFVLLVIAADSGVMPQTREHLQIMEILGIRRGIVALTKSDLIEEDLLEICEIDVRELLDQTMLKDAPLLKVSARTGQGLDELKGAIARMYETSPGRPAEGVFRMYIDRIFSKSGFGTIVTGTVIGGHLEKEEEVVLLSENPKKLRVRRIERHGEEVASVQAGDRASINLVGLEKSEFTRGMVIADRELKATIIADASLQIHAEKCKLGLWSKVIFHTGTCEQQARIHLINSNKLACGESAIVQIHFADPVYLQHGDRFVIRNSSCDQTIGGGEIIDAAPLHHRRRPEKLVNELELVAKNKLHELVALELKKARTPLTASAIARNLNVSGSKVLKLIETKTVKGVLRFDTREGPALALQSWLDIIRSEIITAVSDYRKKNPLSAKGSNLDELRSTLKLEKSGAIDDVLLAVIKGLVEKGRLRENAKTWLDADDSGAIDTGLARKVELIENFFSGCGRQAPLPNQLKELADREKIAEKELKAIVHHLVSSGRIIKTEDTHIHVSIVDECRRKLIDHLSGSSDGIKVADFRDLIAGNRKICLLLLAHFDAEGTTLRQGDFRYLKPARTAQ